MKIFVSDYDGTLNRGGGVTERDLKALDAWPSTPGKPLNADCVQCPPSPTFDAYAVTRRVYLTTAYGHVLPIPSGNRIIARIEFTVVDHYIFTSSDMDPIPPFLDGQTHETGILYSI